MQFQFCHNGTPDREILFMVSLQSPPNPMLDTSINHCLCSVRVVRFRDFQFLCIGISSIKRHCNLTITLRLCILITNLLRKLDESARHQSYRSLPMPIKECYSFMSVQLEYRAHTMICLLGGFFGHITSLLFSLTITCTIGYVKIGIVLVLIK